MSGPQENAAFYRPELDGLRAVALIGVFLFHLNRDWLPGGFVGVDVFFVLSGYLITTLLCRKHAQGTLSLLAFYQRRIARLFPALLTTALVTLLASSWIYSSWDHASTAAAFSASILSIANIHHAMQGDYFELTPDAQPLLHYWSLSVEEQFYFLYPLLLCLLLKGSARKRIQCLILLTLASFATSLVLTRTFPEWAFYLLPSRAWELLAGAGLALILPPSLNPGGSPARNSVCFLLGLGLIAASYLALAEGPAFTSGWAALPVVGSLLVIHYSQDGLGQRCLSHPFMVSLGRLSYSLYLWHWPVFSMVDYGLVFADDALRTGLKIGLSATLAMASYHGIERPARVFLNRPANGTLAFTALAVVVATLGPLGYALRRDHYVDASDAKDGALVFESAPAERTIVIMGDSQATMYSTTLRDLARQHGLRLVILSQAGQDPLPHSKDIPNPLWQSCHATIQRERPDTLIIACRWDKLAADPDRLPLALDHCRPFVGQVVLLTSPPQLPASAHRDAIRRGSRPPFHEVPAERQQREHFNQLVMQCASEEVIILDTDRFVNAEDGTLLVYDSEGAPLFHDRFHFTAAGAKRLEPALEEALGLR